MYDGTTIATVTLSDNHLGSDLVTLSYAAASFADKNVGNGKAVSVAGITIAGQNAGNYHLLNATAVTSANIAPASLTVTAASNGEILRRHCRLLKTPTYLVTGLPAGTLFAGDSFTTLAQAFQSNNVFGTGGSMLEVSYVLNDGNAGLNYAVTSLTASGTITFAPLTVSTTGVNKVYDGTTATTVTLSDNHRGSDVVNLNYTTASFADKNVSNGKGVSVAGISISGQDAGNYNLQNTISSTTANITPAPLAVMANAGQTKVYSQAMPTLTYRLSGFVNGETSSLVGGSPTLTTVATAVSHVAGGPYPILVSAGSLSALDYSFVFVGGTFSVTPIPLTITVDSKAKEYAADFSTLNASYTGG